MGSKKRTESSLRDSAKLHIADEITATHELKLKCITMKDAASLHKLIILNQNHFSEFEFTSPDYETLFDLRQAIETLTEIKSAAEGAAFGLWFDAKLVGYFSINEINWAQKTADVGFWLDQSQQSKGLGLKALQALVNYCHQSLKLQIVTAHTALSNARCQRLLVRAGFSKTSIHRAHIETRDRKVDAYRFEIRLT